METPAKKICPNCSQLYQIKSLSPQIKGNIPLFLKCGHTMCETCITNIINSGEPIQCKFCKQYMEVEASFLRLFGQKKTDLYQKFPINTTMLGELVLQVNNTANLLKQEDIDLDQVIKSTETPKETNQTDIKQIKLTDTCKIHKSKQLELYCKDCNKAICAYCMIVVGENSCKNHDVVAINEMVAKIKSTRNKPSTSYDQEVYQYTEHFIELCETSPTVREVFKRLTNTAVDVGNLIQSIQCDADTAAKYTKIMCDIDQHFSKIIFAVLQHKKELVDIVNQVKTSELESLRNIQSEIEGSIKKTKDIINLIDITIYSNSPQGNIAALLEEAKLVANTPWHLDVVDSIKEPAKLAVYENLCTLFTDSIYLEGNLKTEYKLCSTKDIKGTKIPSRRKGIVFPPKVTKDEGQIPKSKELDIHPTKVLCKDVPTYRSKSGSNFSPNSLDSNNSENKIYVTPFNKLTRTTQEQQQKNQPIPLRKGTQEIIHISHIVDPYHFYVQRDCHRDIINSMRLDFRNALSLPKPALNHVTEVKYYLGYKKVDDMWQRCRILSEDKDDTGPRYKVFYIDFGSTDVLNLEDIRLLPLAKQEQLPLAIKCSLANCTPKRGGWSSDDSLLIQNIINNKQAIIHVRDIRKDNNSDITLECDLTTIEEGISVAHALVFHERATLIQPNLPYPEPKCLMRKPILIESNSYLSRNAVEKVHITFVESPDKFFVIKQHLQSFNEMLTKDLEHEYSTVSNTGSIYLPEEGMLCAVNLDEHEAGGEGAEGGARWARGVVRELPGRGFVRVALPDSGATLLLHWTRLKYLHNKFLKFSAMAAECHLAGLTPIHRKWSAGSVELLNTFKDKLLELHVEDTSRPGSIGVTLFDISDEENVICINKDMIKYKFAITFGLFEFNKPFPIDEQVYTNKPNERPKSKSKEGQIKILTKACVAAEKPHTEEHNSDEINKGPIRLEARVLYYQSPSLIYVSLLCLQKNFNTLYNDIQSYYSNNKTLIKEDCKEGDRCCALCGLSQTWRRAYILEKDKTQATIFYSDFGVIDKVPLTNLRELTPEFTEVRDAAVKCHLGGVVSPTGDEWPNETKEYLNELLDAYPRIFVTKNGYFNNDSLPIDIWVYHVTHGGALEPNTAEWRCLNKKLIEEGLAIPYESAEVSAIEDEDAKALHRE